MENTSWCSEDNIADENNNSSISDHSTLTDKNANNIESTEPTGVANVRNAELGSFNSERCVLQSFNSKSLDTNSQINIHPIPDKLIKGSISVENEVLAVYNNSNLAKQQTGPFNPHDQGKLISDPRHKSNVALHSALRAKEAQVNLNKAQVNPTGQSRNQGYTLSEVEIHYQLWKMFIEKMGVSEYEFPLSEQSDDTPSFSASVFPSLPRYCSDEMWCTARGGNLNATATLQKVRIIVKQAVPKAKSLPSSCAKPLQQAPVPTAGGNLPRSDLAISAKTKAELKAQSNLKDYSLLNLNTSVKAFHQPTAPLQEASPCELLAAVQDFLPISASLDSKELPSGRQVPNDPQGRKQTGQGSHQGEQSKGAMSGSVQSGGISSGVGGQSGASGGDGGDGDPPWKDTRSHYDEEPKPPKKKKKKKVVEVEKEVLNSADSVTSDDEPKPKPQPQLQLTDESYNEWESDDAWFEHTRQNDSGTHPESPAPTPHSTLAEEEDKTQPHFPGPCLPDYTAKMSYFHCQNVKTSLVSPEHEETQNLPMPFPRNMSLPRLSPQSLSPPTSPSPPLEDVFLFPPSSPHDSAVSFQSEASSASYSSLSDTSTGIEETQNPDSELPVFPPLASLPTAEPGTTANSTPPLTTMEQPNLLRPFRSQVSPSATSESATDDDSDASNDEKGDQANG